MKNNRWVWSFFFVVSLVALGGPIAALTGCPRTPPVLPPTPDASDASTDADPLDARAATCAAYCDHVGPHGLKCVISSATHHDAGCVEVCTNVQNSGAVKWNLACRARVTSCAALDTCEK